MATRSSATSELPQKAVSIFGALPPPRTPRPESLLLMILSDKLIRGANFTLLQGFSNLDLDSSPSETERLRLVLQIW